jgi:hypothetical protein
MRPRMSERVSPTPAPVDETRKRVRDPAYSRRVAAHVQAACARRARSRTALARVMMPLRLRMSWVTSDPR